LLDFALLQAHQAGIGTRSVLLPEGERKQLQEDGGGQGGLVGHETTGKLRTLSEGSRIPHRAQGQATKLPQGTVSGVYDRLQARLQGIGLGFS